MNEQSSTLILTKTHAQGTVKELISHNIQVNGFTLDKASLGVLLHLGVGECIGEGARVTTKGRAPKVYRIPLQQEVVFSTEHIEEMFSGEKTTEHQEEKEFA